MLFIREVRLHMAIPDAREQDHQHDERQQPGDGVGHHQATQRRDRLEDGHHPDDLSDPGEKRIYAG